MKKILSFIIPAYNAEQYLIKCLDSFILSDSQETIEVFIINDGSKDHTEQIALEYSRRYQIGRASCRERVCLYV